MRKIPDDIKLQIYPILAEEEDSHLHVMPICCGHEIQSSNDYRWDGRNRTITGYAFWQYTIAGEGALEINGKTHQLREGDAMLLCVPEDHLYYLPKNSQNWEFLFISFWGKEAFRLVRWLRKRQGSAIHFDPQRDTAAKAWQLYRLAAEGRLTDAYLASSLTYDFLLSMCSEATQNAARAESPEFVSRVHAYCTRNIHRKISIDEMAKAAGYSRYHFCRLFRKCHGIPPMEFVLGLKLKMAKRLLILENLEVKEVAQRCGFDNTSYFCKVFRKEYGVSPGQFQEASPAPGI